VPRVEILTVPEGYIADYIDGTFRKDTPEEYGCQNIEKRLINEHKYISEQVAVEELIRVGSSKRCVLISPFIPQIKTRKHSDHSRMQKKRMLNLQAKQKELIN
jgi:hypothetical protein